MSNSRNSIQERAIASVHRSNKAYCKFITANDVSETGSHQAGFHIHKDSWELFFDRPGEKGENKDCYVTIKWQDEFETESRFIYYGRGTRNEYRLTRFGKGFPFLNESHLGDLLVICRLSRDYFEAFVLETEDDMESFFKAFGISASQANRLIDKRIELLPEEVILGCFLSYLNTVKSGFPTTASLSLNARLCYNSSYGVSDKDILKMPDSVLLNWLEAEYQLFKTFENDRYSRQIKTPFNTVEALVEFANEVLNRRKSRAGKSLENHLGEIFHVHGIKYSTQETTEENKRPDFLFPSHEAYHNPDFSDKKLTFLAAKTTCKDRWRQILNEADRIKTKHLFTLQQGISSNQLSEMSKAGVKLVVPKAYLKSFPEQHREEILTLEGFVQITKSLQ